MLKRLLVNHTKSLKPVLVETSNVLLVYVLYFAETVFSWVCSALLETGTHGRNVGDAVGEFRLGRLFGADGVTGGVRVGGLSGATLLGLILGEKQTREGGKIEHRGRAVRDIGRIRDEVNMHGRQTQDDLRLDVAGHGHFLWRPEAASGLANPPARASRERQRSLAL